MISRNHAEVVRQPDGTYQVRDLGSRRGTFVGSRKIDSAALRDGDELLIGPLRLRFEVTRPPALAIGEPDELRKLRAVVELSRAIGVEHDLDRLLEPRARDLLPAAARRSRHDHRVRPAVQDAVRDGRADARRRAGRGVACRPAC